VLSKALTFSYGGTKYPAQIKAPQIAHFVGPHRPRVAPPPATAIRLSRAEIEAALVGKNNINPHTEEIIDRIVLEMSRMDGFAENTPPFREHHETALRLLRELGLYPLQASG
jgi:hypothetical protein